MSDGLTAARKEARDDVLVTFGVMLGIPFLAAAVLIAVIAPISYIFLNRL